MTMRLIACLLLTPVLISGCGGPQEPPSLETFRVDYASSGCGVVEGYWEISDGVVVQEVVQAEGDASVDVDISATGDVLNVPWRIGADASARIELQEGDEPVVDARACIVVDWAILNLIQCVPES